MHGVIHDRSSRVASGAPASEQPPLPDTAPPIANPDKVQSLRSLAGIAVSRTVLAWVLLLTHDPIMISFVGLLAAIGVLAAATHIPHPTVSKLR